MQDCPSGFYCPAGTAYYGVNPCPVGYFNDLTNLASKDQCLTCANGFRCNRLGMTNYNLGDNACIDGYLCPAKTQTMKQSSLCTENSYCIAGVSTFCPAGTYGPTTGLAAPNECVQCQAGSICTNFNNANKLCTPGYYCPGGVSAEWNIVTGICPVG
jgi:hypothetical protein